MKRATIILSLLLFASCRQLLAIEPCRAIHGRAISYSGDGFLEIWQVGTHHTFFVVEEKSSDLIFHYLRYPDSDHQALFADFTVCPTERFKQGFSQPTIVKMIRNARVVERNLK
jgi:hypothetical protein